MGKDSAPFTFIVVVLFAFMGLFNKCNQNKTLAKPEEKRMVRIGPNKFIPVENYNDYLKNPNKYD